MTSAIASANLNWVGDHIKKLKIPQHFYDVPQSCPAIFSTKCGTLPKRQLPTPPSPPCVRSDINGEIRRKATALRQEFPGPVRNISKQPNSWYDLHEYFDAVDLWYEGPVFLYYVLNHLYNENVVLDHDLDETKLAEIRQWAKGWVEGNVKRILAYPPTYDLILAFDECEKQCIQGLDHKQLGLLRTALNDFRQEYDHFQPPVEEVRMQAPPQSIQHMPQPDSSFHAYQHPQMQNGQPMIPPGIQMIPPGGPMGGPPYLVQTDEPRRNQMMFVQPVPPPMQQVIPNPPPPHIPYKQLMDNRGHGPFNGPDFHQDVNSQWERRQRGYSNETSRNGRGRGFNNFGNQDRSNCHVNDRRMANDHITPRGSPLRRASQSQARQDLIYVRGPQQQASPFDGDATPRAVGRNTMQNNQRMVSEPVNSRKGYSNDARLWQPSEFTDRQRANSKPQEFTNTSQTRAPFEGHPQAVINPNAKNPSCTFWYEGEPRRGTENMDPEGSRTVYVKNFQRSDFVTHGLKELFAQYGRVEYIHYLYASLWPSAFITFMDEDSVNAAIMGLRDHVMPSGQRLVVNLPNSNPRSRSQSQSSQYSAYEPNYRPAVPGDFSHRGNSRRYSVRNLSMSSRAPNTPVGSGEHTRDSSKNPSEGPSPVRTPLTEGFQAQLQPAQSLALQQVALKSTFAEITQHQAAINRFSNQNQTPLGNIENRTSTRNFSDSGFEKGSMVMSQGSHNRKENSPTKKGSAKSTPFTSPKKDSSRPQGTGHNQKSKGGKSAKKNQAWRDSRGPSPVKTNFEGALLTAMEAEEKRQTSPASVAEADAPKVDATPKSKAKASKAATPMAKVDSAKAAAPMPKTDTQKTKPETPPAKTDSPKPASPKVVTPKTDSNTAVIVPAKKSEADGSDLRSSLPDEPTKPVVEAKNQESEGLASTVHFESDTFPIPIAVPNSGIDLPAIVSLKPDISMNDGHKSGAEEKASLEKASSPAPSSKSQRGEGIPHIETESKSRRKKNKRNKQRDNRDSNAKSDAGQSTSSLNSKDSSETLKSSFMTDNADHFVTARSSPNPSLTSGPSDACLCADDTATKFFDAQVTVSSPLGIVYQEAAEDSKANTNTNAPAGSTPDSAVKSGKKVRKNHSKTDSNSSTVSTGSVRKAAMKSKKSGDKADENAKPAHQELRGSQKEKQPSSLAVDLDDSTQWPTLGSAKAPSMVDSKQPTAPAPQPLSERKKNPNAPIIPAVPLNMQRRRPSINSMAWPIVKKCDMK